MSCLIPPLRVSTPSDRDRRSQAPRQDTVPSTREKRSSSVGGTKAGNLANATTPDQHPPPHNYRNVGDVASLVPSVRLLQVFHLREIKGKEKRKGVG